MSYLFLRSFIPIYCIVLLDKKYIQLYTCASQSIARTGTITWIYGYMKDLLYYCMLHIACYISIAMVG